MSSRASSWTLMEDFFVQECCVHGTDLENHGPTSILCDDPLPIESNKHLFSRNAETNYIITNHKLYKDPLTVLVSMDRSKLSIYKISVFVTLVRGQC